MSDGPIPWDSYPTVPPGYTIPPGELGFPSCWDGALGESAIISSEHGELVKVTATRASPPVRQRKPGNRRRETFRLHCEYLGTDLLGIDVRPVSWGAVESGRWMPSMASPYQWHRIDPDHDADQIATFDLGNHDQLTRLRISIVPAGNQGTAEWSIG